MGMGLPNPNSEAGFEQQSRNVITLVELYWEANKKALPAVHVAHRIHLFLKATCLTMMSLIRTEPMRTEVFAFVTETGALFLIPMVIWNGLTMLERESVKLHANSINAKSGKAKVDYTPGKANFRDKVDLNNPNEVPVPMPRRVSMHDLDTNPNLEHAASAPVTIEP